MTTAAPRLTRSTPAPKPGILHLGLGAFFKAFGAPLIEDAISAGAQAGADAVPDAVLDGDNAWGVIGVSLRSPTTRDALAGQDNVYTMVEMAPDAQNRRTVNVLNDVIFAPEDPAALLAKMADPAIKIVSLTVTEKGYCHIPSSGQLDTAHPDIQRDIASPIPTTAVGYLVRALALRHAAGVAPFTVLSCDNLPNNGHVARNVTLGLAREIDPGLADWIAANGRFPATMVDRIVPATTPANITDLTATTGTYDAAPVFHEPFCQWVIEDSFVNTQRPALDRVAGVQLVDDVAPFEAMKIRMLNGTHSSLAYLGYLAGHGTISGTVHDPAFRSFVQTLWQNEIIPTVVAPPGVDLTTYVDDLLTRYSNPSIRHKTWQIAMDGSQKLPQRILATIADNHDAGRRSDGLTLAVAAWMRYVGGTDEIGQPIDVKDPLAQTLRQRSDAATTPADKVTNLLGVGPIFGDTLPGHITSDVVQAYEALCKHGARHCVQTVYAETTP